ncbi:MAG: CPBP family intramembrane metalloprotease [Candidatus Aceula meridiana]|nr:CPBP family intramembrane metalloprotease [Candidatus Aceula meridiana]
MHIPKKTWILFISGAFIALACWLQWSYSDFAFVNLKFDKSQALKIASHFLSKKETIDPSSFKTAITLGFRNETDRYLQKTIGFKQELRFLKKHGVNPFYWAIRFFRESEKEEFHVTVSSSTGEIIGFFHTLENTAERKFLDVKKSEAVAKNFLSKNFGFDFSQYTFKEKNEKKRDNRTDHSFIWRKKDVDIPWSDEADSGTAKLLTHVTVSGEDVLSFTKNNFSIPDGFSRFIQKSQQSGQLLSIFFAIAYYLFIVVATFFVVICRNHLVMQKTKKFFIACGITLFILSILYNFNNYQNFLSSYPTTSSLKIYFTQFIAHSAFASLFLAIMVLMPALAGESFQRKNFPEKKQGGFLHYILSSFRSRSAGSLIILGYLTAIMMLGIQSIAFHFGRQYCGVWTERFQLPQLSSSYFPFLAAFIIGIRASFVEEVTFRLFGINWGKEIFKNVIVAAVVMSLFWGFGHTNYAVFPMWFRGIEVTFLGFLLSFVYLRYGIIPVIVAHYLFDVFWGSSGFLFGQAKPFDFYSCLFILLLPLFLAAIAFVKNKSDEEKPLSYYLGKHQKYNLRVLSAFLNNPENTAGKKPSELKKELLSHGWDAAIIAEALKNSPN